MKRAVFGWGPAAVWAGVLFLLSAWEDPGGVALLELPDEILHVGIYSVLGATLWWARHSRHPGAKPHWFCLAGWIYALSDEWHQSFVVGRDASVGDVISDWVGVVLGFGTMVLVMISRERKLHPSAGRLEPTGDSE